MNFTHLEKVAIADVLMQIMNADGIVDNSEISYMTQLRVTLDISLSDIQEAKEQDSISSLHIIRKMSELKKNALTIMIIEMIKADGHIDPEETKLLALIANLCNLPIVEKIKNAYK